MGDPDKDRVGEHLVAVRAALDAVQLGHPETTIGLLSTARAALDNALNEAMAQASLAGSSLREVAHHARVAPNTVGPRLARTDILGGYRDRDGRLTATGVARARYDHEQGRPAPEPSPAEPLRFRRRDDRK